MKKKIYLFLAICCCMFTLLTACGTAKNGTTNNGATISPTIVATIAPTVAATIAPVATNNDNNNAATDKNTNGVADTIKNDLNATTTPK